MISNGRSYWLCSWCHTWTKEIARLSKHTMDTPLQSMVKLTDILQIYSWVKAIARHLPWRQFDILFGTFDFFCKTPLFLPFLFCYFKHIFTHFHTFKEWTNTHTIKFLPDTCTVCCNLISIYQNNRNDPCYLIFLHIYQQKLLLYTVCFSANQQVEWNVWNITSSNLWHIHLTHTNMAL